MGRGLAFGKRGDVYCWSLRLLRLVHRRLEGLTVIDGGHSESGHRDKRERSDGKVVEGREKVRKKDGRGED